MDLIFFKILLTRNIPMIHSSIWYSPRPGHSPRFDPKKLRESMKLNLSTEVFFTLTSSLNRKLNTKCPSHLLVVPSSTVATVLKQGRRQSEIFAPANMSEICFDTWSEHECNSHWFQCELQWNFLYTSILAKFKINFFLLSGTNFVAPLSWSIYV